MQRLILRIFASVASSVLASVLTVAAADPIFENATPVGFNPADSTIVQNFVSGNDVSIRVDLNQAATPNFPVVGHFHAVERSDQLSATDTDGLQIDVAIVACDSDDSIRLVACGGARAGDTTIRPGPTFPSGLCRHAALSRGRLLVTATWNSDCDADTTVDLPLVQCCGDGL